MRGRKVNPVDESVRGNPGKRAKRPSIAERIKVLADAPAASSNPLAPPLMLNLEEFAGAVTIWNEYAPMLAHRNVVDRVDRHTLAMFCYYLDRFWTAVAQLAENGSEDQRIKTTSGSYRIVAHPAVDRRDDAAKFVFDLSAKFGFTPLDRFKLVREMAGAGQPIGGLLDGLEAAPSAATADQGDADDIAGFAARNAAVPPSVN